MIKRIVDMMRKADGYAGIAVYRGADLLFNEGLEPELAGRLKVIFEDVRSKFPSGKAALVIGGYTINMLAEGDIVAICQTEGRFSSVPDLSADEPEYTAGQAPAGLISREEARKEAAAMLKTLLGQG